jgi:hypothetical protein
MEAMTSTSLSSLFLLKDVCGDTPWAQSEIVPFGSPENAFQPRIGEHEAVVEIVAAQISRAMLSATGTFYHRLRLSRACRSRLYGSQLLQHSLRLTSAMDTQSIGASPKNADDRSKRGYADHHMPNINACSAYKGAHQ